MALDIIILKALQNRCECALTTKCEDKNLPRSSFAIPTHNENQNIALQRFDILLAKAKAHGDLLDCGCGPGEFIAKAQSYFDRVVGVDIDQEMVSLCQKRFVSNPRLSFFVADIENFSLRENFDFCSVLDVLEHTQQPEKALRNIYQMLKEDGTLLFSAPNWYNRFLNTTPGHKQFHSSYGWKNLLEKSKFQVQFIRAARFPLVQSEWLATHLHLFGEWVLIVANKSKG